MIHVSTFLTRKINHPSEVLKKATMSKQSVLEIDKANQRISLGLSIGEIPGRISTSTQGRRSRAGQVTKLASFGAFVWFAT